MKTHSEILLQYPVCVCTNNFIILKYLKEINIYSYTIFKLRENYKTELLNIFPTPLFFPEHFILFVCLSDGQNTDDSCRRKKNAFLSNLLRKNLLFSVFWNFVRILMDLFCIYLFYLLFSKS